MKTRQLKTYVYIPLLLKETPHSEPKLIRYKQLGIMDFVKPDIGDTFVVDKRKSDDIPFSSLAQYKVASVLYSLMLSASVVELEPKEFKKREDLDRF